MKCTNKQCIFELTPVSKSLIFAFKHEKWILNCQKQHNVKLRSLDYQTPRKSVEKEKLNFLMNHYSKFQDKEISMLDFIKMVGNRFSAKTDI